MKKIIIILFTVLLLAGCSSNNLQGGTSQTSQVAEPTPEPEPIPAFESEAEEILPLPTPQGDFADMDELIDSIFSNYEVIHITDFENEIAGYGKTVKPVEGGYRFSGPPAHGSHPAEYTFKIGAIENYFDTPDPDNYYAVLARFKLHSSYDVKFGISTRFGGMAYAIEDNIYPAIDFYGDGADAMYNMNWNNFIYEPGEWAYVLISATQYSQLLCYSWAENDINDYTYFTSYADIWGFDVNGIYDATWWTDDLYWYTAGSWGGEVIISDFWIYSYEELKR